LPKFSEKTNKTRPNLSEKTNYYIIRKKIAVPLVGFIFQGEKNYDSLQGI